MALPFIRRGLMKYFPSDDTVKETITEGQKAMYNWTEKNPSLEKK